MTASEILRRAWAAPAGGYWVALLALNDVPVTRRRRAYEEYIWGVWEGLGGLNAERDVVFRCAISAAMSDEAGAR